MAYDDTSFYGDMIFDEYDDKNNLMNPETPVGFLFYHILGDGFDKMSDMCSKFLNDLNILSADASSLDKYWGISYNLPRPTLPVSGRLLTDEEYRVYMYLLNCRLITVEDILINFNKCFGLEDNGVYLSEETNYLEATDHLSYEAKETIRTSTGFSELDRVLGGGLVKGSLVLLRRRTRYRQIYINPSNL